MNRATALILPLLFALSGLAGCYAQVEDPNVSLTHDLCPQATPLCIPGGSASLSLVNLVPEITVGLGSSTLLSGTTTSAGPVTLNNTLILNDAVLTLVAPASGADFSGVTSVTLSAIANNDTSCTVATDCTTIATYDQSTDGVAGKTLPLKGSGVNLISITGGGSELALSVRANGTAPAAAMWAGTVTLDMSVKARGSFP